MPKSEELLYLDPFAVALEKKEQRERERAEAAASGQPACNIETKQEAGTSLADISKLIEQLARSIEDRVERRITVRFEQRLRALEEKLEKMNITAG